MATATATAKVAKANGTAKKGGGTKAQPSRQSSQSRPAQADKPAPRSSRAKSIQAEKAAVDDLISSYADDMLDCRVESHLWHRLGAYMRGTSIVKLHTCPRCETVRTTEYTRFGFIVGRRYEYPEGYHLGGQVELVALRVESMQRITLWASEGELMESLTNTRKTRNGSGRR